ncbi:MAG: DUF7507 domain-containing protein [Rhodoglobus sp.]
MTLALIADGPSARRNPRGRAILAVLLTALLSIGLLPLSTIAAVAATGDYTVDMNGPATVPLRQGFSYDVTLEVEATPSAPATGIVLTSQLPEGIAFDSVPTGGTSPVDSYTYDPATRIVTFVLKPLVEQLVGFTFAVTQVNDPVKDENTVFPTTITGSTTPGGVTPTDSVTTNIVGDNNYLPRKSVETLVGSGNRTATYFFNISTTSGISNSPTFTSWAQRLTDTFPAGVIIQGTSSGWTVTANGDGTTTAVWDRTGTYGPSSNPVDTTGTGIWITVQYPEAQFPGGTLPPANTVGLETMDHGGTWHSQPDAVVQGPELSQGIDKYITVQKNQEGLDQATFGNGTWGLPSWVTAVSYINTVDSDNLESLVVTDAASQSTANAEVYDHFNTYYLDVRFNATLQSADVPYTIEYTTSGSSAWQSYVPTSATTGAPGLISVEPAGSVGWQVDGRNQALTIPAGERLTGWRVVVSPDAGTTVPSGSEVRVRNSGVGSYPSLSGGSVASAPMVNTATATATSVSGTSFADEDPLQIAVVDRVNIITVIDAPSSISVGGPAQYSASITNLDPAGRTYHDNTMKVVLPVGVLYDASVGASATAATTPLGIAVPQIGAGVTVTLETVTDAEGEHQVVVFHFDELVSVRTAGQPAYRGESTNMFSYTVPVTVQPQAYVADGQAVESSSWAFTSDPAYASTPMAFYGPYYATDRYSFDPNRDSIARSYDKSIITTAGGLLLGKLVRESGATAWAPQATVPSPGTAEWQVYVANVLPQTMTDIVVFDRLPVVGDGRGSDFPVTLSGPVAGVPAGGTVEYSTDATTVSSGTWSTNPAGATAFRVSIPSMANGESLNLVFPTAVPAGLNTTDVSTNNVTATGIYGGTSRNFFSTEASISPTATPAVSIVKETNGVDYAAAPGAVVATGSTVTWTYSVTNTGNTVLDTVEVSDTFTAGDGSTGSFDATSTETGPLAPGATRTFTATGAAIAGQYENTATVTGVAVDENGTALAQQPVPATDTSWYFAGDAGLTVVKLTNGEDVTSAPGLPLTPGSNVEWSYTVTNAGNLDLTDVLVVDVDAQGVEVFRDTIPLLKAGESVTLTTTGTAIEGQYNNTVTATAADPSGATDGLSGADDSWYFGVVSGVVLDKTVATSEQGPFSDRVTVTSGASVWWKFVVTNTGNVPLVDVVITDNPLGAPLEVDDLQPGQSATYVVRQDNLTAGYKNVAVVEATDPGVPTDPDVPTVTPPKDVDEAVVGVTPPTTAGPTVPVLVNTGLALGGSSLAAALLLLVGGAIVIGNRRRNAGANR